VIFTTVQAKRQRMLACYVSQTTYSLMKYDTKRLSSDGYEQFCRKKYISMNYLNEIQVNRVKMRVDETGVELLI